MGNERITFDAGTRSPSSIIFLKNQPQQQEEQP